MVQVFTIQIKKNTLYSEPRMESVRREQASLMERHISELMAVARIYGYDPTKPINYNFGTPGNPGLAL